MPADMLKDLSREKTLLVILGESEYPNKLEEIIRTVKKDRSRICYLCFSKPYADVVSDLKERNISLENFFFIDVLSSHYGTPEPVQNCIFIPSPSDLERIGEAIAEVVEKKNCSVVIFDTISTLLVYQQTHSIIKFTNSIVSVGDEKNRKIFIVLKEGGVPPSDIETLTMDLEMFADKKLDLSTDSDINKETQE